MSEDGLDGKPESSSSRLPGPTTKVAFGKADASPMLDRTDGQYSSWVRDMGDSLIPVQVAQDYGLHPIRVHTAFSKGFLGGLRYVDRHPSLDDSLCGGRVARLVATQAKVEHKVSPSCGVTEEECE